MTWKPKNGVFRLQHAPRGGRDEGFWAAAAWPGSAPWYTGFLGQGTVPS